MTEEKANPDFSFIYDEVKRRAKGTGYLDRFKESLFTLDDQRKEERKQKWLAKDGRT